VQGTERSKTHDSNNLQPDKTPERRRAGSGSITTATA